MTKTRKPTPVLTDDSGNLIGCDRQGCLVTQPSTAGTLVGACNCPSWKLRAKIRHLARELAQAKEESDHG